MSDWAPREATCATRRARGCDPRQRKRVSKGDSIRGGHDAAPLQRAQARARAAGTRASRCASATNPIRQSLAHIVYSLLLSSLFSPLMSSPSSVSSLPSAQCTSAPCAYELVLILTQSPHLLTSPILGSLCLLAFASSQAAANQEHTAQLATYYSSSIHKPFKIYS